MNPGKLRDRVFFYRLDSTTDSYGNPSSGYSGTAFAERWGRLRHERGRERIEAGRLQSAVAATLWVRDDSTTQTVTAGDKATIGGVEYQIRSVAPVAEPPGMYLELTLERGVGV